MKKSTFERIYDFVDDEEIVYSTISEQERPDAIVMLI